MIKYFAVALLPLFFTLSCGPSRETKALMEKAAAAFGKVPDKMPLSDHDTKQLVSLGEKLYNDKRLSVDNTVSCASCHVLDEKKGGVDNTPTSEGVGGKHGDRNAPTVLNAGFHVAQFWDGRAATLADQAKGPILNPIEMAMPNADAVVKKLKAIREYEEMFTSAFPDQRNPLTYDNVGEAIAAFERTLHTTDRFDDFIDGNPNAISSDAKKGLDLFLNTGCNACHNGPLLGGQMFQKMGQVHPYSNTRDIGRSGITKKESDRFVFRVPSLRNVMLTAPYFHDGGAATIEDAVKQMAYLQLGKELSSEEVRLIVEFLKTMTDKTRM